MIQSGLDLTCTGLKYFSLSQIWSHPILIHTATLSKILPNKSDRIYKLPIRSWYNIPWCCVLVADREFVPILVWEPLDGWPDGGFGNIWGGCLGFGQPTVVPLCCSGTVLPGPAAKKSSSSRKHICLASFGAFAALQLRYLFFWNGKAGNSVV